MVSGGKITNSQIMKSKKKSIKNIMTNIWESYKKYTKIYKF
jgi:hypothetical protein